MNVKLFDTHTHYDDIKFDEAAGDKKDRADYIRAIMKDNDICGIIGVGVDISSSAAQIDLASKIKGFYAACGFHPENIPKDSDVESGMESLYKLLQKNKVVAIGEIGLDYYWKQNPLKAVQILWFERQLELSERLSLPVVVHSREAHGDCFECVRRHKGSRGVFHSYSGSAEMAKALISNNYMISFTGVVTFKNASRVCEVVKSVPIEYIMLETDCPYMAPVPMRGKVNHSGYLIYTAQKIAEIKNIPVEEVVSITCENAKRFFKISELS